MVTVETIGRIRRAFLVDHKPIRQIVRELRVSRKTVRKAIRGSSTEFRYDRQAQPQPRLGEFVARLDGLLEANSKRPARERLTARRLFELLRAEGYQGAYDSVQRHARAWRRARSQQAAVCILLWFAPGEAYQFDWSHEVVVLGGVTTTVKVAHIRLCHSRMFLVRAYPRETQEMVFAAHDHAFRLFGGACRRGIYDNMTTAVARSSWARSGASTAGFCGCARITWSIRWRARRRRGALPSCAPMPIASSSGVTARSSASTSAASDAARPPTTPGITCRCWPESPGRCATATRSATGICRRRWRRSGGGWPATTTAIASSSIS